MTWPVARLDNIARLRAIVAAYPTSGVAEVVLDRPVDEVWSWLMDFEHTTSRFDGDVTRVRVRSRSDRGVRMWVWAWWLPIPLPFDVTIEPGFCLMRSALRGYVVVMAAEPTDDGRTRYVHAEAVPRRGWRWCAWRVRREVAGDVRRLREALGP